MSFFLCNFVAIIEKGFVMMRVLLDKILRSGIKLCMLTGVAFTFAACYGPAPDYWDDPEFRHDQEQTEQQIQEAIEELSDLEDEI